MNENEETPKLADGVKLLYTQEDAGRVTDNHVYLAPGVENVVEVGRDLSGELAHQFVARGICAVYTPAVDAPAPKPAPDVQALTQLQNALVRVKPAEDEADASV